MSVTPSSPGRIAEALQRFLLPAPCLHCGRPLGAGLQPLGLCPACRGALKRPLAGCAACGAPLPAGRLRPLAEEFVCGSCRRRPPAYGQLRAAWSYEGPMPAVVAGLKYRRLDYLGAHLAREIAAAVEPSRQGGGLVVPIPLHWRRRWLRGFNQAERIARPLAAVLGLRYRPLLRRVRSTRPQARLVRAERLANPSGAFALRRGIRSRGEIEGERILLVDDVTTTGATLGAAASVLTEAGAAEVTAVVAARTPEGG